MTKSRATPKELRSFGLIVGGIFALIGVWPVIVRGGEFRWWAIAIALLLVIPALLAPKVLRPTHVGWNFIGHILGWINTRILLGLGFLGLVTPVGLAMRILKKDPMRRKFDPNLSTYRMTRVPRSGSHMYRQF